MGLRLESDECPVCLSKLKADDQMSFWQCGGCGAELWPGDHGLVSENVREMFYEEVREKTRLAKKTSGNSNNKRGGPKPAKKRAMWWLHE